MTWSVDCCNACMDMSATGIWLGAQRLNQHWSSELQCRWSWCSPPWRNVGSVREWGVSPLLSNFMPERDAIVNRVPMGECKR